MNPWKGLKELPRNMWYIAVAALINRAGTMVLPFLALYLTREMKESASSAGLVITIYGLGALLTAPFVGKLSDLLGELKLMKISLIASCITLIIFSFFNNYISIALITFCWAIINEAFRPANMSLISKVVSPKQRRPAFALNRLAVNLGMSIGPLLGGFLAMMNFTLIFYVDAVTSLLAGLFLIFVPWENLPAKKLKDKVKDKLNKTTTSKSVYKDFHFLYYLIALLPVPIVYLQHQAAMPLFLVNNLNFSESTFGALFTINTVMIILFEVPLNNLLINWRDKVALSVGALLVGIGFGAMAFAHNIYSIIITIVIWTLGEMILFPASSAFVAELAPDEKRGEYMGVYQMTFSFSFTIGPWLGTLILQHFGAAILWSGAFIFCLISAILFLRMKEGAEYSENKG